MILIAVIVGYILGVAPFVLPKAIEMINSNKVTKVEQAEYKDQSQILDEWLNGSKEVNVPIKKNQEDIYNEYITGKEVAKGE